MKNTTKKAYITYRDQKKKIVTPDERPKLKRTTDRNDYSFIIVKILDFIVTRMSRNTKNTHTMNAYERI